MLRFVILHVATFDGLDVLDILGVTGVLGVPGATGVLDILDATGVLGVAGFLAILEIFLVVHVLLLDGLLHVFLFPNEMEAGLGNWHRAELGAVLRRREQHHVPAASAHQADRLRLDTGDTRTPQDKGDSAPAEQVEAAEGTLHLHALDLHRLCGLEVVAMPRKLGHAGVWPPPNIGGPQYG